MDLSSINLMQWVAWILSTLAGIILATILIPKPVKGGMFTIFLAGIIGALVGTYLFEQVLFAQLTTSTLETLAYFFLGAFIAVLLVKILLQETKLFRTQIK